MASLWYDVVPCCCDEDDCKGNIVAVPDVEMRAIMVRIKERRGKVTRVYLAPGWASVLAAHMEQAADQLKPRTFSKPHLSMR